MVYYPFIAASTYSTGPLPTFRLRKQCPPSDLSSILHRAKQSPRQSQSGKKYNSAARILVAAGWLASNHAKHDGHAFQLAAQRPRWSQRTGVTGVQSVKPALDVVQIGPGSLFKAGGRGYPYHTVRRPFHSQCAIDHLAETTERYFVDDYFGSFAPAACCCPAATTA